MRELLIQGCAKLVCKCISPYRLVARIAKASNVDLLPLAYNQIGILKYQNEYLSGEQHLWELLGDVLGKQTQRAIIDCGANTGNVVIALRACFPRARLLALEPNPVAHQSLLANTRGLDIETHAIGLGDSNCTMDLHVDATDPTSEHASLYSEVSRDLHRKDGARAVSVSLRTLDSLASDRAIDSIAFLKIDTEGHELSVLRGAKSLIARQAIDAIQFEFNEMNVMSRVFLRDFYAILPGYAFFRLDTGRLIELGEYSSKNEIFRFQNIVAFNEPTVRRVLSVQDGLPGHQ
ncbi:MAG TPA: FkbM family methyltransferase [Caulifigura sp.]|jgi:FkbM family methyltransferase|nr:FkbM family methyltransferase [Caulifigura sp.]